MVAPLRTSGRIEPLGVPQHLVYSRRPAFSGCRLQNVASRGVIVAAGTGQFNAQQIGATFVGGHPHREFASARMAHHEQSGAARSLPKDAVHRPIRKVDALLGRGHSVRIRRRAAVSGPVERHHREAGRRTGPQQRKRGVARAVEIEGGGTSAVDRHDDGPGFGCLGDHRRHRHAVHDHHPGRGAVMCRPAAR